MFGDLIHRLDYEIATKDTIVCCGLDPDLSRIPFDLLEPRDHERTVQRFLEVVIDITAPHVCAYKIQKAFFDLHRNSKKLLKSTIQYVREHCPNALVVVDCKIGDIGNTMKAYLEVLFSELDADAVVASPYMGPEVWSSFYYYPQKAAFLLVRTSGMNSGLIQDVELKDGRRLWQYVLELVVSEWKQGRNLFPILSCSSGDDYSGLRTLLPDEMPIFLAGVGEQGGSARCIKDLLNSRNRGVIVNSARALLYPYERSDPYWKAAMTHAVITLKEALNEQRQ